MEVRVLPGELQRQVAGSIPARHCLSFHERRTIGSGTVGDAYFTVLKSETRKGVADSLTVKQPHSRVAQLVVAFRC